MERREIFRMFFIWDWEKEEAWLNEMASQGWHFVRYRFPWKYVFERGEPGAYQYRLQALENLVSDPQSRDYLAFLQESGIEPVDSYLFWAYLRKPADGHPFELFSDTASRLKHMKRFMMIPLAFLILLCFNLVFFASTLIDHGGTFGTILVLQECILACLALYGTTRMMIQYRELERKMDVQE